LLECSNGDGLVAQHLSGILGVMADPRPRSCPM
jgi:hypothetical protein